MSEKTVEYLLFLFKSKQMWPEIIDACENFGLLTGNKEGLASDNEIRNYYLSDTLLQIPSKYSSQKLSQ